jgi:hypothetical protein
MVEPGAGNESGRSVVSVNTIDFDWYNIIADGQHFNNLIA